MVAIREDLEVRLNPHSTQREEPENLDVSLLSFLTAPSPSSESQLHADY